MRLGQGAGHQPKDSLNALRLDSARRNGRRGTALAARVGAAGDWHFGANTAAVCGPVIGVAGLGGGVVGCGGGRRLAAQLLLCLGLLWTILPRGICRRSVLPRRLIWGQWICPSLNFWGDFCLLRNEADVPPFAKEGQDGEIGRASCRERV